MHQAHSITEIMNVSIFFIDGWQHIYQQPQSEETWTPGPDDSLNIILIKL